MKSHVMYICVVLVALFASGVHGDSYMYRMCTNNNNPASYYFNFNGQACNSGYSEWNSGTFRLDAAADCTSTSSRQIRSYIRSSGIRKLAMTNPDPNTWTDEGIVGCGYTESIGYSHGLPIIYEYSGPNGYAYVPHTHSTVSTNLVLMGYTLGGVVFAALPLFYSAERTSCFHPTNTIRVYTYSSTCPSGYTNEGIAFRTLSNADNLDWGTRMILNSYYSSAKTDRILAPVIPSPNIPSGYVIEGFWGSTYNSGGTGRAQLYSFYKNVGGNYDRFYTTNPGPFSGYTLDNTNSLGYVATADNTYCGPDYPCPALEGVTRCYNSAASSYYWYNNAVGGSCPSGYTSQGEVGKVLHYNICVPESDFCKSKCIWGRPLYCKYDATNNYYSVSLYTTTEIIGCGFLTQTTGPSPRPGTKWKQANYGSPITNYISAYETEYTNTFINGGWQSNALPAYNAFPASTTSYCNLAYNTCSSVTATNPFYPTTPGV